MSTRCRLSHLLSHLLPRDLTRCVALVLGLHCAAAVAEPWQFEAGAGVLSQQQIWKKTPVITSAIPYFIASNGGWRLGFEQGNLVSYSFVQDDNFRLYAGAGIRDNGYDADTSLSSKLSDDPVFTGYQAPDTEITGSVGLRWYWFSIQLAQQLDEDHNAQLVDLALELPLFQHQSGLRLMAVAAASWMNADYTQRIYGVAAGNQNLSVGRPVFQTEAEVNYRLGMRVQYPLSAQTVLLGSAGVTQLADNLQLSPLVDEDRSIEAILLLVYRF